MKLRKKREADYVRRIGNEWGGGDSRGLFQSILPVFARNNRFELETSE